MGALTDIPTAIGTSLGMANIGDAQLVGGLILSSAVMMAVVLMMSYAGRGKGKNLFGEIVVMFSTMGVLTAISWLPPWVLVIGVVALAALFGGTIANMVRK